MNNQPVTNIIGVWRIINDLHQTSKTPLPKHPGEYLKEELLALKMTGAIFAKHIGASAKSIGKILNSRDSIDLILSLRLARALNTTPDYWLNLQIDYDLSIANALMPVVNHIPPLIPNEPHHERDVS